MNLCFNPHTSDYNQDFFFHIKSSFNKTTIHYDQMALRVCNPRTSAGGPVVENPSSKRQGIQVRSLVGEIKSHSVTKPESPNC